MDNPKGPTWDQRGDIPPAKQHNGRLQKEKTMKDEIKQVAKTLHKELQKQGVNLKHSQCLDICSKLAGMKSYHVAVAKTAKLPKTDTTTELGKQETNPIKAWIEKNKGENKEAVPKK